PRRDAQRGPRQRSRLIHRAGWRETLHQVAPTPEGGERQSTADDLAEAGEIGSDPVPALRPAPADPEPGDDLVEQEECTCPRGLLAQRLEEPRRGRNYPHVAGYRLDDDGGDVPAATAQELPHSRRIVEFRGQGEGRQRRRDTRAVRHAERQRAGPCPDQQRIDVPVVAARKLDDQVPSGGRTREAERAHGRLAARAAETRL